MRQIRPSVPGASAFSEAWSGALIVYTLKGGVPFPFQGCVATCVPKAIFWTLSRFPAPPAAYLRA